MTEITDEILSKLDYDEVKNKKIFQKFLALQQNGSAQPERNNFQNSDNEEHDQNLEAQQDRSRMNTITEESRSHTNLSPDRKNTSLRMKNHGNNNITNFDKNDSYDKRIHSEEDNYHRRQDNYAQQDQFRSSQGQQQQFHEDRQQYSPQQVSRQQRTSPGRGQQQDHHGELENSSKLVNGDYFSNSVGNKNIDRRNQQYDDSREQSYSYPGYQNRKYSPQQQQQQQQQQYQRDGMWNEQDQYSLRPFDHNNNNNYYNNNNPNNFRNRGVVDHSYDERRDTGNRIGQYDSDMRGMMMRGRGYEQGPRGLEERCADQEQQINRMAAYIQDFKEQSFRESSRAKTQMLELETTIQALKERLYDLQRREDELTQENEKLKQRITHEQALRTSTEEDLRAANARMEEIKDMLEESKRESQRKESESAYIRQQMETMKQKHSQALASSELTVSQLREEKDQLTREMDFSMGNGRQLAEMQEKTAALQNENKRVYLELDESKKAALELTHLAEQHKNELYSAKHRLIEKAQRETQLNSRIESQAAEIETLKQLLYRAETSLLSGDGQNGLVQQRGNQQEPGYLNSQNANGRSAGNLARPRENRNNNNTSLGQMNATTAEPLWGQRQNQGYSPQRALKTSEDIERSPEQFGTRRSNHNNNNNKSIGAIGQQQPADARRISAENKNISIQLRNKNTNTPSNFLSWEVPDQQSAFSKEKDKRQQGQQQQQQQDIRQVGNTQMRDDSVDRMYRNVQQQLGRDQQYVSEQFQLQAQQKFNSKQQQHQAEQFNPQQNQASRGNRHANAGDYSQIYNQYNKQETASPEEGRRGREKNQVKQTEQVKGIESNLLMLNVEKDQVRGLEFCTCCLFGFLLFIIILILHLFINSQHKLSSELSKLEQVKLKSAQNIRRRNEITEELSLIQNNISSLKTKLREANALY